MFTRNVNKSEINFVLVTAVNSDIFNGIATRTNEIEVQFHSWIKERIKKNTCGYSSAGDYEILNPKAGKTYINT